jgi:hypothetical protein
MKSYKQFVNEQKATVARWQAGVRSSQLAGTPEPSLFKDPDFQAGYKAGIEKGSRAEHPSFRAKRVKEQEAKVSNPKPTK